jgi:hypothetical protein
MICVIRKGVQFPPSNQTYTSIFNLIDGPDDTEIVSVRGLSAIEPAAGKVFLRLSVTMP